MDVASYFPNISAVRHEDSEETTQTQTSSIDEEKEPSSSTPMRRGIAMGGRRRHDPVLSTIPEVLSSTSILPADSSIICFLCLHKITGTVPNFIKPCQCPLVFVHTTCALDSTSFFGSTCTQCQQKYRPESTTASPTRHSLASFTSIQKKKKTSSSSPKKMPPSSDSECVLCHNQKYRTPDWPQKSDARLIQPCFCGFLVHHGCVVELLDKEKACEFCGVKFRYVKYGSFSDFCKRYSIQHVCYALVFATLLFFFVLAFRGSFVFRRNVEVSPIVLTIISIFFFCVFVFACLFTIKHTLLTRLPRFRQRYGHVTVVPYDPDVRSKKQALRSLEAARFQPCNDDGIPLNTVAVVEVLEETMTPSDLSLGEHMFGIAKNNHRITSSTPLNHKQKTSVFESSEA
uniref:Uncharacterized protein n=1 Tax=Caenorhabditis japonica TaxID=281687 RepID=A0A8R1DEG2_CAEJA